MKTLSIKQPWAELIIQKRKTIEIRKWDTKFRGRFLVHASKNPDEEAMKKFGFKKLPLGNIVGMVELVDIKKYKDSGQFEEDSEKHLATSNWGDRGFILENAKRINPIPAKGNLGFWDFDLKENHM